MKQNSQWLTFESETLEVLEFFQIFYIFHFEFLTTIDLFLFYFRWRHQKILTQTKYYHKTRHWKNRKQLAIIDLWCSCHLQRRRFQLCLRPLRNDGKSRIQILFKRSGSSWIFTANFRQTIKSLQQLHLHSI